MTVTTIRPNSTDAQVAVTVTSGTVHSCLSDNSDSTVVRGTSNVGYAWVGFANSSPLLTATQRVESVTTRFRLERDTADIGGIEKVRVRLRVGSAAGFSNIFQTSSGTPSTKTGNPEKTAPGNVAWSQVNLDALQVEMTWYASVANSLFGRANELYVDVNVNNQPTVTGTPAVTGQTLSTRPTATWAGNDVDNDPLPYAQTRWFSASQYGAGNFSADTSPSTWDSGELTDGSTSAQVGVDLVNGTTYKVYVRVGQAWGGPEGTKWWSTWVPSGAFTIALTPPATPSLLATLRSDPLTYAALLDVTAPVNLLTADNSSFEGGLGQTVALANCTVAQSSAGTPPDGAFALQMTSSASGDMTARSGNEPFLGQHVKGGLQYTFLASFRSAVSVRTCFVGARWQDAAGVAIGADVYGSGTPDTTSGWTQVTATLTAPTNAKSVQVLYKVAATGAGAEVHRVDKAGVQQGTSTVWTPGGYSTQVLIIERGERVDTGRGTRANWAHPDVASGGSVRQNSGYGFYVSGDSGQDILRWEYTDRSITSNGFADIFLDSFTETSGTTYAPSGNIHWAPRSGAASSLIIGGWPYGTTAQGEWQFPVVVGQVHVVSYWAWVDSGTIAITPKIDWMSDDTATIVLTTTAAAVTLTTVPQQIVVTATCPGTASAARLVLTNHTASATTDVHLTRVGWGLGTSPVDVLPASGGPLVWTTVRGTGAVQLAGFPYGYDAGQRVIFADYDVPADRPVIYRARLTAIQGVSAVASLNSAYATLFATAPAKTVLRDVLNPSDAVLIRIPRSGWTETQTSDEQWWHPHGRDGDPIAFRDWLSGQNGAAIFITLNDGDHVRLRALLELTQPLLIQYYEGGQTYARFAENRVTTLLPGKDGCGTNPRAVSVQWVAKARP